MRLKDKNVRIYIVLLIMILIVCPIIEDLYNKDNFFLHYLNGQIVLFIYFQIVILWGVFIYMKIIDKNIRRYLIITVFLMLFWIFIRNIKFKLYPDELITLSRYTWYFYYIPMIFIPLCSFYASLYLRKDKNYKINKKYYILFFIAVILFIGILTNDFHELAFAFENKVNGVIVDNNMYSHGIVYYMVAIFMFVLEGMSIFNIVNQFEKEKNAKKKFIPFFILCIGIIYTIFYNTDIINVEFVNLTEMMCTIHISIWESCILIGLIPSNFYYSKLFAASSININIVDKEGKKAYASHNAGDISKEQFEILKQKKILIEDENTQYDLMEIKAGYAISQHDISQIMKTYQELFDIGKQLKSEYQLLQEEVSVKKQNELLNEKRRIYKIFQTQVKKQRQEINSILINFEKYNDEEKLSLLKKINIMGVYIKRRYNLVFLKENKEYITLDELKYCLHESLENLKLYGVDSVVLINTDEVIKDELIIKSYDLFQELVEVLMQDINTIFISTNKISSRINLNMQFDIKDNIESNFNKINKLNLKQKYQNLDIEIDENELVVSILLEKGER